MKDAGFKRVPIVGQVSCGSPGYAESDVEGYLLWPEEELDGASFVLRVMGESMAPTYCEGDLVFVRQQPTAEDGDAVIVCDAESATLKRLYRRNGHQEFRADNPVCVVEKMEDPRIAGVVVGFYRREK